MEKIIILEKQVFIGFLFAVGGWLFWALVGCFLFDNGHQQLSCRNFGLWKMSMNIFWAALPNKNVSPLPWQFFVTFLGWLTDPFRR